MFTLLVGSLRSIAGYDLIGSPISLSRFLIRFIMAYRQTEKTKARQLEVRQAIVDAALDLITNRGFSGISIRAVAEKAKLASGSVYKHFASKSELCSYVFRLASKAELARVANQSLQGETVRIRLQQTVIGFSERAIKQPRLSYALIAEPVDPLVDAERIKLRQDYADVFAELITEGMQQKEFVEQQANISAAALVGIIAETLVVPLSRAKNKITVKQQSALIGSIQELCMRAVGSA